MWSTDQIADGYIPLQVISKEDRSRQTPLCGKISLPWRTEALQGHVEVSGNLFDNCYIFIRI